MQRSLGAKSHNCLVSSYICLWAEFVLYGPTKGMDSQSELLLSISELHIRTSDS